MDIFTELSLFSGGGGGLLATQHLIGFRTICYVEKNKRAQAVLQKRIQEGYLHDAPIWDDVTTFDGKLWRGLVDVVTAGFPCQPYSSSGKRLGSEDHRNLWPDTIRIIRECGTPWVLLENVTDVLSFDYVRQIFADLSESGFDARWEVISAFEVGAPHPRERLWIVANATGGRRIHEKGLKKVQKAQQRRKPNGCTWWETEPEVRRVDDELARGMGRANALLGEGQVPLVVKEAWNRMTDWREK